MPLEVLVGLVQLVKGGRGGTPGWPTKGGIVLAIGAQRLGGWFTAEDAAEHVGRARGTCARLLAQLDDERVILRDPGVGGEGRRGGGVRYWVEVNPRWEDWHVRWRVPRRVVRQRAVLMHEMTQESALRRFFARSYDARYPRTSARLWTRESAALQAQNGGSSRGQGPREFADRFARNTGGRGRSSVPVSRGHDRAKIGGPAKERSLPGDASETSSSVPGVAPRRREVDVSVNHSHFLRAVRLIEAVSIAGKGTGRPVIFPKSGPWSQVRQLVADHGLEAIELACKTIEATTGAVSPPPMTVETVAGLLAGDVPGDVDEGQAAGERRRRAELAEVRTHIGSLVAMGANDAELAEWREREASLESQTSGPTLARAPATPDAPEW